MTRRTHAIEATVSNTPRTGVATSREVADFLRSTEAPIGDLTGVDAVGHLVDLAGQIGPLVVAQMLGGDRPLAGDLAAALALGLGDLHGVTGLGDLHGVTGLAASARSRASFSFSMK
jgi:hypothetical protein